MKNEIYGIYPVLGFMPWGLRNYARKPGTNAACRLKTTLSIVISLLLFVPFASSQSASGEIDQIPEILNTHNHGPFQFEKKICFTKQDPLVDNFSTFKTKLMGILGDKNGKIEPPAEEMNHSNMFHMDKKRLSDFDLYAIYPRKYYGDQKENLILFPKRLSSKPKPFMYSFSHVSPKQYFKPATIIDSIYNTQNENLPWNIKDRKEFLEKFVCNSFMKYSQNYGKYEACMKLLDSKENHEKRREATIDDDDKNKFEYLNRIARSGSKKSQQKLGLTMMRF